MRDLYVLIGSFVGIVVLFFLVFQFRMASFRVALPLAALCLVGFLTITLVTSFRKGAK